MGINVGATQDSYGWKFGALDPFTVGAGQRIQDNETLNNEKL